MKRLLLAASLVLSVSTGCRTQAPGEGDEAPVKKAPRPESRTLTVEGTEKFLKSFMDAFYEYSLRVLAVIPQS